MRMTMGATSVVTRLSVTYAITDVGPCQSLSRTIQACLQDGSSRPAT